MTKTIAAALGHCHGDRLIYVDLVFENLCQRYPVFGNLNLSHWDLLVICLLLLGIFVIQNSDFTSIFKNWERSQPPLLS